MKARNVSQRGGVLVQALIVIAGLLMLMATLAANQRTVLNALQYQLRDRRAEVAARAALQSALAALQGTNTNLVTLNDTWAQLGSKGTEIVELGDATYRVEILDASARINLNTVTQEQLQLLPITQEQLDSLLDWREAALQARTEGAKDDFYTNLTVPYNTKLGRLTTLHEVLAIKGWTINALLNPQTEVQSTALTLQDDAGADLPLIDLLTVDGAAPNTQADGTTRVNINQPQVALNTWTQYGVNPQLAALLSAQGPYTSFSRLFQQPGISTDVAQRLLEAVTFTATPRLEGKINLNTASQAVLTTIPNMTTDVAAAIVSRQASGFAGLGDLATIPGLTGTVLGSVADACGVGSDTWIVRAYGESGGSGVAIEAVVGIRNGSPRILTYDRLPNVGIPTWWKWEEGSEVTQPKGLGST